MTYFKMHKKSLMKNREVMISVQLKKGKCIKRKG